jgi:hypothetical protein
MSPLAITRRQLILAHFVQPVRTIFERSGCLDAIALVRRKSVTDQHELPPSEPGDGHVQMPHPRSARSPLH